MSKSAKIAVIGGGSWGTALVKILMDSGQQVSWWMRNEEAVEHIHKYHHNLNYLSSVAVKLPEASVSTDINAIAEQADYLLLATPSAFLPEVLATIDAKHFKTKKFLSAVKGIIPQANQIVGEFLFEKYDIDPNDFAVISGPSHAEEIALEKLSYLTLASQSAEFSQDACEMLRCRYVITIPSDDIYGTEFSAVLKNIYAIACGICHGLGYGDNFQAVLVSNAMLEIRRFVDAVHPIERDINESAYLGDLLVTAYSQFSRNRTFGNMLGKGYSVKAIRAEMNMVAEGYYAVACMREINKQYHVNMPILDAVYGCTYGGESPALCFKRLTGKMV